MSKDIEWERTRQGAQHQHPKYKDSKPGHGTPISTKSSGVPKTGTNPERYEDPDAPDLSPPSHTLNNPHTGRAQKVKGFGRGGDLLTQKAVASKLRGGH